MQVRLTTKFTLTAALLVLAVAALLSSLYLSTLARMVIRQADDLARFVAQQTFFQSQQALQEAARQSTGPATASPEDVREYVRRTLDENEGVTRQVDAAVSYSPGIYEVSIVDRDGTVLISSDSSLPGRQATRRMRLEQLAANNLIEQLRALYGPQQVFEYVYPFNLGADAFGEIRVGYSTTLLRTEFSPGLQSAGLLVLGAVLISTLLGALVSRATLAPLRRISKQLDQIAAGRFDPERTPAMLLDRTAGALGPHRLLAPVGTVGPEAIKSARAQRTPGNAADRRFDVRIGKIELSLGESRLRALDCRGGLLERRKCVVVFALADRFARGERFQAPGFALGLLLACAFLRERRVCLCDGNLVRRAVDHEQHGARVHGRTFGVQALLDNSGDARADLDLARALRPADGLECDRHALGLDTLDGDRYCGWCAARCPLGDGARLLFAAGKKEYGKARTHQVARTRADAVRTFFGKRAKVHTERGTGMWTQEGAIISNPGCCRCAPRRPCDCSSLDHSSK